MIPKSKYLKWIRDQIETDLELIAVGYNPKEKIRIVQQQGFDLENPITDIKLFSKIFSEIIEKNIGNKFEVRLIDTNYSFLPKFFPKENPDVIIIKNYLNKISWKNKKFFGAFIIINILDFFEVFINYSLNYSYQDILLFSVEKDFVIQISHHGDIWLSSTSKSLLKHIGDKLDKKGATVIYGNIFKTV